MKAEIIIAGNEILPGDAVDTNSAYLEKALAGTGIEVQRLFISNGLSFALAESCSGGLASHILTNVAGASSYFQGGVVAYNNKIKEKILGVSPGVLKRYGAVSGQAAKGMAEGIRRLFATDVGMGITGIAGPGGATGIKPVGLVYIAISAEKNRCARKFIFSGSRVDIKNKAAAAAMDLLIKFLKQPIGSKYPVSSIKCPVSSI